MVLEAAIALPVFLVSILTIAFFSRVVTIQNQVQHALNQAATEISTYSYVYHVSGMQKAHDRTKDILNEAETRAAGRFDSAMDFFTSMQKSASEREEGGLGTQDGRLKDEELFMDSYSRVQDGFVLGAETQEQALDTMIQIFEDPKKEMVSVVAFLANGGMDKVKRDLGGTFARFILQKHLDQRIFKKPNIGAFIVSVDGKGKKAFDFSKTNLFKDNQTIDIRVAYTVELKLPIRLIPPLYFEQRAFISGFLVGYASYLENKEAMKEEEADTYWDLRPFDRGRIITQEELEKQEYEEGTLLEVRSIDLYAKTYQSNEGIENTLKSSILHFVSKVEKEPPNAKRVFILVCPDESIQPENQVALMKKVQFAKDHGVEMVVKQGYGKPKNARDKEQEEQEEEKGEEQEGKVTEK
jgi:hypothetical protein